MPFEVFSRSVTPPLASNSTILTAMKSMADAQTSYINEQENETHKYCRLVVGDDSEADFVQAGDVRNLTLHLADFHYIREELATLYCF